MTQAGEYGTAHQGAVALLLGADEGDTIDDEDVTLLDEDESEARLLLALDAAQAALVELLVVFRRLASDYRLEALETEIQAILWRGAT